MKIGIVGSGLVGSTSAYAMVMRGVGREIVLVDQNRERASAEADDIYHAVPFTYQLDVHDGDYPDLVNCRVVVITAGVSQRPGESRLELLGRNAKVFQNIVPAILEHAPNAILLVATNPVDVMTHLAARYALQFGVPSHRVIGTGTSLDTARFRALLGHKLGIDPQHVHAYVLGEHGDTEVLAWSLVSVGGIPLDDYCAHHHLDICGDDHLEIDQRVRNAAYHIISGKGATYYGIGSAVARIAEVILRDQRSIFTVCTPEKQVAGVDDVTLSLPHLVGGQGVLETLCPTLSQDEQDALNHSAKLISGIIRDLEKSMSSINA
jgi:L-lactate dehydrogenase